MIRVHAPADFNQSGDWPYLSPDDLYHDFEDASAAAVSPDGSLILTRVEVRKEFDPAHPLSVERMRTVVSNPQLVVILPEGMWGPVERFDDEGESGA